MKKTAFFLVIMILFLGIMVTLPSGGLAQVGASNAVTGWAWSDNIGWISLSSSNIGSGGGTYEVVRDPATSLLSGYAWSSNVGWVTFNQSELANCPRTPCEGKFSAGGILSGWARALTAVDSAVTTLVTNPDIAVQSEQIDAVRVAGTRLLDGSSFPAYGAPTLDSGGAFRGLCPIEPGGVRPEPAYNTPADFCKAIVGGYTGGKNFHCAPFTSATESCMGRQDGVLTGLGPYGSTGEDGGPCDPYVGYYIDSVNCVKTVTTTTSGGTRQITTYNGGWDGWISLNTKTGELITYGPARLSGNTGLFSGFAWGADIFGWLDFSGVIFGRVVAVPLSVFSCTASPTNVDLSLATVPPVIWTATISGGTPPFTYVWSGDSLVAQDRTSSSPLRTNSTTVIYNTATPSSKNAYISVTDSGTPVQSVNQASCSDTVSVSNPDFTLSAGNFTVTLSFVGQSATSNPVAISLLPSAGFVGTVALSAVGTVSQSATTLALGGTSYPVAYKFYDHGTKNLNSSLASGASIDMVVTATKQIPAGTYNGAITVTATDGQISHTYPVNLRVGVIAPVFEEF